MRKSRTYKYTTKWWIGTIIFLLSIGLKAQVSKIEYRFYGLEEGLTQGNISLITQSKEGFIWMSTWDGLVRYDGYSFKTYKASPGDGNTINNSKLYYLSEDFNGNLWVNESKKAILFDVKTEQFHNVLSEAGMPDAKSLAFSRFKPLKGNPFIWLFYEDGNVFRVNLNDLSRTGIEHFSAEKQPKQGTIQHLFEDSHGNEWITASGGVFIYGNDSPIWSKHANVLIEWKDRIWIGGKEGYFGYWNPTIQEMISLPTPLSWGEIVSLTEYDSNRLLVTTKKKGAYLFDYEENEFVAIPLNYQGALRSAFVDQRKNIWFEPEAQKIIHYRSNSLQTTIHEVFSFEKSTVFDIKEDQNGRIWIIPKNRILYMYDPETDRLQTIFELLGRPNPTVPNSFLRGFALDVNGNAWINLATDKGVFKISFPRIDYSLWEINNVVEVRSLMCDSQKRLWVGSKDNRIRIYNASKQLLGYLSPDGRIVNSGPSLEKRAFSILEDKSGSVWIGTRTEGLYRLEPINKEKTVYKISLFRHNPNNPYSLSSDMIFHLSEDSRSRIWISTYGGGINITQKEPTGEIRFLNHNNFLKENIHKSNHYVRFTKEIAPDTFLLGTTMGLVKLNWPNNNVQKINTQTYQRNPYNENCLSSNDVMSIYQTGNKSVYVSTSGGGFCHALIKEEDGRDTIYFESFMQKNGLISDLVFAMIEDKEGALWLSSESGLSRFFPKEKRIETFSQSFFHRKINFSESIPVRNGQGDILFGTGDGIIELNVEKIKKSSFIPPVAFTDFQIHNDKLGKKRHHNIDKMDVIELNPDERSFSIEYAALDYSFSNTRIHYAYRLRGMDKNWNYVDEQRRTVFSNLPKGKYVFEVRSTNADGIWTDNIRTLQIVVKPRFIESIFGYMIFILLFLLLAWGGIRLYLNFYKMRHKMEMEEEITQLKLRFFTDISHELRTPLTLISSPLEEISKEETLSQKGKRNLQLVLRNTDRLLNLINQILDFRKIQNNKMRLQLEECDINPIITFLTDNFSALAEEKQIEFSFLSLHQSNYLWIDRDKFEKIIINLLSNAFKYTPNGKHITIKVEDTPTEITIQVLDQGIGMDKKQLDKLFERFESFLSNKQSTPSTGIGLSLVKNFVELHHGQIRVESQPEVGSRFTINFTKGRQHFVGDPLAEFDHQEDIDCKENSSEELSFEQNVSTQKQETTLIIVEDNDELREFLVQSLASSYRIIEASNGKEGLEKISKHLPDIILSDIMMPEMDGIEMVSLVKANNSICHIPIILLTAKSSLGDRIEGLEHGIDDYITKPFSISYVKAKVASLLERRKELRRFLLDRFSLEVNAKTNKDEIPINLNPQLPNIQSLDETFIQRLMDLMEKEMSNQSLTVDDLCENLYLSRTVFYNKLKSLTGLSPVDFIKEVRIKHSIQLIKHSSLSVSEVAYKCGFSSQKYFSTVFRRETGYPPSEYKSTFEKENNQTK